MKKSNHRYITQVLLILQWQEESFYDYEVRLNQIINKLKTDSGKILVMPSASSSGRMCCVIHYELFLPYPEGHPNCNSPKRPILKIKKV